MRYNNDEVRRQDRLLTEEEARLLLREGEHGVLSVLRGRKNEGYPEPVHDGVRECRGEMPGGNRAVAGGKNGGIEIDPGQVLAE